MNHQTSCAYMAFENNRMPSQQKISEWIRLTCEYDVGQPSAAVRVQHVGPHMGRVMQAAVAAPQAGLSCLGVVERG